MRIAIPVTEGKIPNHLGHCEKFLIATVEGGKVISSQELANPGHGPGGPPPVFLANQGVNQILAWGIPPHARGLFEEAGIKYLVGATGSPETALQKFLEGTLNSELTTEALDAGGGCGQSHHDGDHDHE